MNQCPRSYSQSEHSRHLQTFAHFVFERGVVAFLPVDLVLFECEMLLLLKLVLLVLFLLVALAFLLLVGALSEGVHELLQLF